MSDPSDSQPKSKAGAVFRAICSTVSDITEHVAAELNYNKEPFNRQEALGASGQISVAIPAGGTGEVTLRAGSALRHFPARAQDKKLALKRGEAVTVTEVGPTIMLVAPSTNEDT